MQTTTQQTPAQTVMTVTQAADYLGLAVSTLNKWRCHGGGPIYIEQKINIYPLIILFSTPSQLKLRVVL